MRRRHDGRSLRRAARLAKGATDAWQQVLDGFALVEVELAEVINGVAPLMSRYGLSSYDAAHMATASYVNVSTMFTLDTGFANVPPDQLSLYTDKRRVRKCRRYRGGRARRS